MGLLNIFVPSYPPKCIPNVENLYADLETPLSTIIELNAYKSIPTPGYLSSCVCMYPSHIRMFLDQLGILNFGMREVDRLGVGEVVARCLDHLKPSTTSPLHLSYDIDALDPLEAPSTGTPGE